MSFPIASIAVVNSVLFGVYSNTLLALTATSYQDRRAQPPGYTQVFIAGCTGGFLQVRTARGCTRPCTHTDAARVNSFLPLPAPSRGSQLQTRPFPAGMWGAVGKRAAPAAPAGLACPG